MNKYIFEKCKYSNHSYKSLIQHTTQSNLYKAGEFICVHTIRKYIGLLDQNDIIIKLEIQNLNQLKYILLKFNLIETIINKRDLISNDDFIKNQINLGTL